ncbi:hypothetical protein SAMD00019534_044970, partial [Acytostelium subglobosum LB1]|uniref:hypothetical protein n=1 Tax=Acytostelium subglobosum LB1 TaxID=1410327 RepID=UPI000644A59E
MVVTLQFHIISKIASLLDDRLDRMSLVLSSNYLFQRRHLLLMDGDLLVTEVLELLYTQVPSSTMTTTLFDIPSNTKRLTFGDRFSLRLELISIPNSVTELILGGNFNQPLNEHSIPSSIRTLEFGYQFNQPLIIGSLPPSITSLKFGSQFNQSLRPGTIPDSVINLTFGSKFKQPLRPGTIPDSVIILKIGELYSYDFKQPLVRGSIPSSVTTLDIGSRSTNSILEGSIPPSVRTLNIVADKFISALNQGFIPLSLTCLSLYYYDNDLIDMSSLTCLRSLKLREGEISDDTISKLPHSITKLSIQNFKPVAPGIWPPNLHTLKCSINDSSGLVNLPPSVTTLHLDVRDLEIGSIPSSVRNLHLSPYFNQSLEHGMIPSSVISLDLGDEFRYEIPKDVLSPSVTQLNLHSAAQFEDIQSLTNLKSITLNIPGDYTDYNNQNVYSSVPTNVIKNSTNEYGDIHLSVRAIDTDTFLAYDHRSCTYSFGQYNSCHRRSSLLSYPDMSIPFRYLSMHQRQMYNNSNKIIHYYHDFQ